MHLQLAKTPFQELCGFSQCLVRDASARLLVACSWQNFCLKSLLQTWATMSPGGGLQKISNGTDLACRTWQAAGI